MKELIYKEDARRAALHNEGDAVVAAIDEIKPVNAVYVVLRGTVDAVPVVRCGKCRRWNSDIKGCTYVNGLMNATEDCFCSYGEEKKED